MMYNILCDGVNIYDSSPQSGLLNPKLDLTLNEPGSLTFDMLPTHSYYDTITPLSSSVEVMENENLIFFGRVLDVTITFNKVKKVTCEGALGYLYDTVQMPAVFDPTTQQTTIHDFFNYLLTEHNKLVTNVNRKILPGTCNLTNKSISRVLDYDKTMDCIKKMCIDSFGGYLFLRKTSNDIYLDWLRDLSGISNQPIQYAINLTDYTNDFKGSDMVTSIIPIGDDDLDVSGTDSGGQYINQRNPGKPYIDSDAVATYGRICQKVNFDGITNAATLYEYGLKWLTDKQFDVASMEVNAADLKYFNPNYDNYALGQSVHVTSTPHLIDTSFPIMKISYALDSPTKVITLGTPPRKTLTDMYGSNGGGGSSSGGTDKNQVKKISEQVVQAETPTIIQQEVPQLVQYNKVLNGGVKIGSFTVGEDTDDIFTNTIFGTENPASNLGVDGNIYIKRLPKIKTVRYVRTNYSKFGLTLPNWNYKCTDKFEFIFKNNRSPKEYSDVPYILGSYRQNGTFVMFIRYNLEGSKTCMNINYNDHWTGDNAISFSSPFDYENYYLLGASADSFYLKKGTDLDHIDTTVFTWSTYSLSTQSDGPVKLFCDIPGNSDRPMDMSLYGITVRNSSNTLIHNYIPIEDGLFDTVDMTMYTTSTTGHINGSEVPNDFEGYIESIWYKKDGVWIKNICSVDDIPELITLTEEEYQALSNEEKMDLTKAFFVTDAVPTNNYVIPNPPYEPTRELNTIEINGLVYDIPGDIEPNPEEEPTDTLKTLKIEDTTYQLAGSGGGTSFKSNVFSYKTNVTTNQYGWFMNIPDKDGVPLDITKDIIIDIQTDDNATSPYYGFEPVTLNGHYIAKVMDRGNNTIVSTTITINNVRVSYIKDYYTKGIISEASISPIIYSEEEREIGVWTDGKPLYQRTYHVDSFTSTNWYILDANLTPDTYSIKNVNTNGYVVDGGGYSNQRYTLIQTNGTWLRITQNTQGFQACIDGSPSSGTTRTDCDITIQYTKTTDVPGSGQYTTLGAPAVHYSTDEQVIGTWINGKPLYQKTIFIHNESTVTSQSYSYDNDIPNCDMVITQESCIKLAGTSWVTGDAYTNTSQYRWDIHVNSNTKNVGIQCLSWGFTDAYVTLKYTKTTD